jgi:hypothetical protein
MDGFVWTKMETEFGGSLEHIVGRKEAERMLSHGQFWWGTPWAFAIGRSHPDRGGVIKKAPLCEVPHIARAEVTLVR